MRVTLVFMVLFGILCVGALGTLNAQKPQTQWDGVYSAEQAKRGSDLYEKSCSSCHGADLSGGGFAPALMGGGFAGNWNDVTLDALVDRIRNTMPQDSPGTLSRAQSVDLVAFMLEKNGAPAGATPLAVQSEALKQIRFTVKP